LQREAAAPHWQRGADKDIRRHGIGGLDVSIDAVPVGTGTRDEAQPCRLLVPVALFGREIVTRRPGVSAVIHRVVAELGLEAARWRRRVHRRGTDHTGANATSGGDGGAKHVVGVALVGGGLVVADRAVGVNRLAHVGDAHHAGCPTSAEPQQVETITGLVVDVDVRVAVQCPHHPAAGVDDGANQFHQPAGDVGGCHLQAFGLGIKVHDGLQAPCRHRVQLVGALRRRDRAVGKLLVDLGLVVGGQRAGDLE